MSNYVQSTNFATKDALPSGDPLKIVRGAEINTEFNNIATAVATKADSNSPTLATPTLVAPALGTPVSGNLANCTFPTLNQNTTGNAGTATALQNARTIGGVSFNGTANINLPGVNTAGNQDTTGNAATATNAIDIASGAVGAPRIVGKAAKRFADYPVLTVTAADTYSAANGSGLEFVNSTTTSTTEVVAARFTIAKYTGSLRFRIDQRGGSYVVQGYGGPYTVDTTSTLRIFKNGVLIATYNQSGASSVTRTNDIAIVPGDVIEWRHKTNDAAGPVSISSTVILGTNGYTTRELFLPATEVNNV